MKIRLGFVSNSSSSSFCIVGYPINSYDAIFDVYDTFDDLENKLADSELEVLHGISDYSGTFFIGKEIHKMKDEQTMLDFKKEILEQVKKYYDENVTIDDIDIFVDGGCSD